jgi:diguanylate cyclase (GGDEF)-like protein/PAS domain S-box-containing protein
MTKATKAGSGAATFHFPYGAGLLRNVVESAAVPTFLVGTDGHLFYANRAFGDLLGYTPDEIIRLGIAQIVHPEDAAEARKQTATLAAGKAKGYRAERRYIGKNGTTIWVLASAALLVDEDTGKPLYITVQAIDIDRQKLAEAALAESEQRWNFALEGAGQGVWDHDLKTGKIFFSHMWRRMRGIGPDEEVDSSRAAWLARIHPDDREHVIAQVTQQNSDKNRNPGEIPVHSFEFRERHRDGHWMWILSRGRPMAWMSDGGIARIIGTDTDITSLKAEQARNAAEAAETYRRHLAALEKAHEAAEAAQQLAQSLARHDVLTGLPNRRVFGEALEAVNLRADQGAASYAIMIIDLDRFKPVNDIHGHHIGDDVLREVATRIGGVVRKGDTLARLGGDEFGVILDCSTSGETPHDAAARIADRIISVVQQPISVGDRRVEVGASIGIAICPTDATDPEALLRSADTAMYRAKQDRRGVFCFFERSMEEALQTRIALEEDVRLAVAHGDIQPHYQPLIKLSENRLVGFEILARWHHPRRGDVEPDVFIPVVEKLGLIGELTYALLRRACLDARDWPPGITIALNISPTHFNDPLLPVKLLAILSETGFPPNRLEIEVTETALVSDLPAARAILVTLQDIGIKISLDDFGTGYSSLYNLRELRFDKIKIDRSFVLSMETNIESAKIVRSVIDLAKSLGLPTIAEGIEHSQAMTQIMESGGDYGQGFYFGKAMPADAADELVRDAGADFRTLRRA